MTGVQTCALPISNVRKKSKGTTKCEKIIITCDVETALYENRTVKCEKKVREPPNVIKELLYMMLEPHNVRMKLSNVRKKKVREPSNMRKELSHVILELHNFRMESSNLRKK